MTDEGEGGLSPNDLCLLLIIKSIIHHIQQQHLLLVIHVRLTLHRERRTRLLLPDTAAQHLTCQAYTGQSGLWGWAAAIA